MSESKYKVATGQPALTGPLSVFVRVNVLNVEFNARELTHQIKFYFEACWDDSSDSIHDRTDGSNDKANPNRWDPRIFFPEKQGELKNVENIWIAANVYPSGGPHQFKTPMMAYRFIATAEFKMIDFRPMKDFPFDSHELVISARSREAEELKNKDANVTIWHNPIFESTPGPRRNFDAYLVFEKATDSDRPYLDVTVTEENTTGPNMTHVGKRVQCFKVALRVRRQASDWILQAFGPVLISSILCSFSFMPPVCDLATRQQVSMGMLFTLVAFHLGLKSMDVFPKVPYIMLLDRVFLMNMLVMVMCVMCNGISYAVHGTCNDERHDYENRSTADWIMLGIIIFVWVGSNLWLLLPVIRKHGHKGGGGAASAGPSKVVANGGGLNKIAPG
mmetsp:Transcript_19224/g.48046  ORF Transcript_19224/g.48046 Transcript_19224/m.48046 type:complete len:390 (-) Transcript_19224:265-1434(-)